MLDDELDEITRTGVVRKHGVVKEAIEISMRAYVGKLFDALRSHGYDARTMQLYIAGGGDCLVQNFGKYDPETVRVNPDLMATAKDYEYLAYGLLRG